MQRLVTWNLCKPTACQLTCDRVFVLVRLLLYDLHQVLHDVPPPFVDNDCCSKVPQEVLRIGLDGIQVPARGLLLFPAEPFLIIQEVEAEADCQIKAAVKRTLRRSFQQMCMLLPIALDLLMLP